MGREEAPERVSDEGRVAGIGTVSSVEPGRELVAQEGEEAVGAAHHGRRLVLAQAARVGRRGEVARSQPHDVVDEGRPVADAHDDHVGEHPTEAEEPHRLDHAAEGRPRIRQDEHRPRPLGGTAGMPDEHLELVTDHVGSEVVNLGVRQRRSVVGKHERKMRLVGIEPTALRSGGARSIP